MKIYVNISGAADQNQGGESRLDLKNFRHQSSHIECVVTRQNYQETKLSAVWEPLAQIVSLMNSY